MKEKRSEGTTRVLAAAEKNISSAADATRKKDFTAAEILQLYKSKKIFTAEIEYEGLPESLKHTVNTI